MYKSKDTFSKKGKGKGKPRRKFVRRERNTARFKMAKDAKIEYKNLTLLQKYLNDRGKIIPRRISGVTAKEQRQLTSAIKRARFLALITSGGIKK